MPDNLPPIGAPDGGAGLEIPVSRGNIPDMSRYAPAAKEPPPAVVEPPESPPSDEASKTPSESTKVADAAKPPEESPAVSPEVQTLTEVVRAQAARLAQFEQQALVSMLQGEVADMQAKGATPDQINQHVNMRQREYTLAQRSQQMETVARKQVAEAFVQQLSKAGVEATVDELLTDSRGKALTSPDAMEARAITILEERRKGKMEKRRADGVDEPGKKTAGNQGVSDMSRMTPASLITAGLRKRGWA